MNEFALIQYFFQEKFKEISSTAAAHLAVGIGDDAAVINQVDGKQTLVSCDTLVAGRHFYENEDAYMVGWKAVAVNLSDIAAMGGTPHSILLALSLPRVDKLWLEGFSQGILDICKQYKIQLIGGDTTYSPVLSMTITVLGCVTAGKAILRSGAAVGDQVIVSGELGNAAYALQHLDQLKKHSSQMQEGERAKQLIASLVQPIPHVALGQAIVDYASAMLDVSDGLAQDLEHLLSASRVAATVNCEQIPLSEMLQQLDPATAFGYALSGGDDYVLCLTMSSERLAEFRQRYPQFKLYVVGEITQAVHGKPRLSLQYQGLPFVLARAGFQHF